MKDSGNLLYDTRTQPVARDNLERWDVLGDGREVKERGDIWIPVAAWCYCMKPAQHCKEITLQLKVNKFLKVQCNECVVCVVVMLWIAMSTHTFFSFQESRVIINYHHSIDYCISLN